MKNKQEIEILNNKKQASTKNGNVAPFDLNQLLALPAEATADELMGLAVESINHSGRYMARAGQCFIRLRNSLKHGEFQKTLEAREIDLTHAKRAMQLAEFMAGLPEADARKLAAAPYTKVLAIAQAEPEVIEEIMQSGELDDISSLSVRDLRQELRQRQIALLKEQTKREAAEGKIEKLQGLLAHKADVALLPEFCVTLRQEAIAQTEQMDYCLESLSQCLAQQIMPNLKGAQGHYAERAVGTLYHALRGVLARTQEMVEVLQDDFEDVTRGPFKQEFMLNKGELAMAKETYELIKARHEALTHNKLVRRRKDKGLRGRHGDEEAVP